MESSAKEFYSNNAEKQAKNYSEQDLADEFLNMRREFAEKSEGKLLDAGCGHGRDSKFFNQIGLSVVGVDISEGLIDIARERSEAKFKVMGLRDLNFPDESFDSVWASASVFFMSPEDMQTAIDEFSRVLRPGGRLFITFKLGDGRFLKEKWGSEVEEWHISREKGRKMLEDSGFKILEQDPNRSENGNDFINFSSVKPKESR